MPINKNKPHTSVPDARMFELIEWLKKEGVIKFRQDFCKVIGLKKQNVRQIKQGVGHFTVAQISIACQQYDIDANWIFGFSNKIKRQSQVEMLKTA